jgi:hypothetical protein
MSFHVRLVCAPGQTEGLLGLLNVAVLIVVGALVLRVQRIIWRPREETALPSSAQPPG